jgi:hypothetical protein
VFEPGVAVLVRAADDSEIRDEGEDQRAHQILRVMEKGGWVALWMTESRED